jgi:hypothetical protein
VYLGECNDLRQPFVASIDSIDATVTMLTTHEFDLSSDLEGFSHVTFNVDSSFIQDLAADMLSSVSRYRLLDVPISMVLKFVMEEDCFLASVKELGLAAIPDARMGEVAALSINDWLVKAVFANAGSDADRSRSADFVWPVNAPRYAGHVPDKPVAVVVVVDDVASVNDLEYVGTVGLVCKAQRYCMLVISFDAAKTYVDGSGVIDAVIFAPSAYGITRQHLLNKTLQSTFLGVVDEVSAIYPDFTSLQLELKEPIFVRSLPSNDEVKIFSGDDGGLEIRFIMFKNSILSAEQKCPAVDAAGIAHMLRFESVRAISTRVDDNTTAVAMATTTFIDSLVASMLAAGEESANNFVQAKLSRAIPRVFYFERFLESFLGEYHGALWVEVL